MLWYGVYGCDQGFYCHGLKILVFSELVSPVPLATFEGEEEYTAPNPTPGPRLLWHIFGRAAGFILHSMPCMTYSILLARILVAFAKKIKRGSSHSWSSRLHGRLSLSVTEYYTSKINTGCEGCTSGKFLNASSACEPCPEVNGTQLVSYTGASGAHHPVLQGLITRALDLSVPCRLESLPCQVP